MSISTRIKQVRGERSRRLFAEHIGIVENTLRNYEQDLSLPNSDVIAEICIKENISPEWLVLGNGSMRGGGKEAECGAVRQEFSCFKKDTVYNVLETLEEMLLERGQVMEPTRKAELVCGLCCMVEADAANLRPAQLLRLINGFLPDNSAT